MAREAAFLPCDVDGLISGFGSAHPQLEIKVTERLGFELRAGSAMFDRTPGAIRSGQRVGLASPDNSDTHDSDGRRGRCGRRGWRGRRGGGGGGGGATSYTSAASVEDREPTELQAT
jgi:hypothetical protein